MYIGTYTYTYRESYTITYISAFWENKLEKMMNKNNTNWALPLSVSLPPPSLKTFLATIHLENDLFYFPIFLVCNFYSIWYFNPHYEPFHFSLLHLLLSLSFCTSPPSANSSTIPSFSILDKYSVRYFRNFSFWYSKRKFTDPSETLISIKLWVIRSSVFAISACRYFC